MSVPPILNIAIRAARAAGSIISRAMERVDGLDIQTKGRNDYVTDVDRAAEAEIIKIIHKAYPSHAILAEESGAQGKDDFEWVIDPLDGTTNFLHGFPQFAVSIGVRHKGRLEHAVVYDPTRQELYTASHGGGARLNDRRLRVSKAKSLDDTLLGTGFPFKRLDVLDAYLAMFKAITPQVAGIRRPGSAALDLAYVASGRYDGFWEIALSPWDMAAGALLIQEAGGLVTDFAGGGDYMNSGNLVAGSPKVHEALLNAITPYLTAAIAR